MRRISRPVHGILDYSFGLLLAASPWLFGFSHLYMAPTIAVAFGAGTILYSLFTNYELGLIRLFPFPVHIALDFLSGALLAASFIHFAVSSRPAIVFGVFGIIELCVAFFTERPGTTGSSIPT